MNKFAVAVGSFIVGAIAGAIGMKLYVDRSNDEYLSEYEDNIRKYYSDNPPSEDNVETDVSSEAHDDNVNDEAKMVEYAKMLSNEGYRKDYSTQPKEKDSVNANSKVYVIMQNQFGMAPEGYDCIALTYYEGNDVLADTFDNVVEDAFRMVGDFKDHFGEGTDDPDMVYVRNDDLQCEYEITRDHTSYEGD